MLRRKFTYILYTCSLILSCAYMNSVKNEKCIINLSEEHLKNLREAKNLMDVAVIGSGVAGYSSAIFIARQGRRVVVFQGPSPLGRLSEGILVENWAGVPADSGLNVMKSIEKQAKKFGACISKDVIKRINFDTYPFEVIGENDKYTALTVIIATGATPKKLGIKGEDAYWLKGILSCGLCDAHLAKDQDVIIIGSGDYAVDRVMQLAPYAKTITLLVDSDRLTTSPATQNKIKNMPKVNILYDKEVTEFIGDGKHLTGVMMRDTKNGEAKFIEAKWAFESIGVKPNVDLIKDQLELDLNGYLKVDALTHQTSIPLVYAAGTVSDPLYNLAVTASGDATKAAYSAWSAINHLPIDHETLEIMKQNLFVHDHEQQSAIKELDSEERLNELIKNNKLVVVDFYVPSCSACQNLYNMLKPVSEKYQDKMSFAKMEKPKHEDLATKFNVQWVPSLLFFSDGVLKGIIDDPLTQAELDEKIGQFIAYETLQTRNLFPKAN